MTRLLLMANRSHRRRKKTSNELQQYFKLAKEPSRMVQSDELRRGAVALTTMSAGLIIEKIGRANWLEALALRIEADQEKFVASPLFALAGAFVRRWGDEYDYSLVAFRVDGTIVGYASTVCDPRSVDDYWIDDILIDQRYQGRGYGRTAARQLISAILAAYQNCRTVKLTCHPQNSRAAGLYERMGFRPNGVIHLDTGNHEYELTGDALTGYSIHPMNARRQ